MTHDTPSKASGATLTPTKGRGRISRNGGDWDEYRLMVMAKLDEQSECLDRILEEQGRVRTAIARLEVKAGVWGALGGVASVAVAIAVAITVYFVTGGKS